MKPMERASWLIRDKAKGSAATEPCGVQRLYARSEGRRKRAERFDVICRGDGALIYG